MPAVRSSRYRHQSFRSKSLWLGLLNLALLILTGPLKGDDFDAGLQPRMMVFYGPVPANVPQRWGAIRLGLFNPDSVPRTVLSTTSFDAANTRRDESTQQFGQRIELLPNSVLRTSHLIRVPEIDIEQNPLAETWSQLRVTDGTEEVLVRNSQGQTRTDLTLRLTRSGTVVMVVLPAGEGSESTDRQASTMDFVDTLRLERGNRLNMAVYTERVLPSSAVELDAVDHLVLADDRMLGDAAALTAIREWVDSGGRLWVMLDRVRPQLMEALLGDDWTGQVVDDVGLTTIDMTTRASGEMEIQTNESPDYPVSFRRVLLEKSGAHVMSRIGEWPAAFRMDRGSGTIMVTTLAAAGWLRARTGDDARPAGAKRTTAYVPLAGASQLSKVFFERRMEHAVPDAAATHVSQYIGYSIPSRGFVLCVLLGFAAVMTALSVWLLRRGQLEHLGWLGPLAACGAGMLLAGVGIAHRQSLRATNATFQLVEPVSGTQAARVRGMTALYETSSGQLESSGNRGGWLIPDMTGLTGTDRRLLWTDSMNWQWERAPVVPGLRVARFTEDFQSSVAMAARASAGGNGLSGHVSIPEGLVPADAVLVGPQGRIGVTISADGSFKATAADVLSPEQFLKADLLSDEQQRRSRTLAEMLKVRAVTSDVPELYFWTGQWPSGLTFSGQAEQKGVALVRMPVSLERPEPGASVNVPAPLIRYRETRGPDRALPTGLYDSHGRVWTERSRPGTSWLSFQIPSPLMPVKLTGAVVRAQVTGPIGKLELAGFRDGRVEIIKKWMDPVGSLEWRIDDPSLLLLTDDGQILMRVSAGDPDRPELTRTEGDAFSPEVHWLIESLSMEVQARVPDDPSGG